jgi:hypothetical protein
MDVPSVTNVTHNLNYGNYCMNITLSGRHDGLLLPSRTVR